MTKNISMSDGALLTRCEVAIYNTKNNSEIQTLVSPYGYTPQKMNEGESLYLAAQAAFNDLLPAKAAKEKTSSDFKAAEDAAFKACLTMSRLAHAVFIDDPSKLETLGLNSPMSTRIGEFIATGTALFTNAALPAIATPLAAAGYTTANCTADLARITAMNNAHLAKEEAKALAEIATKTKNEAIAEAERWKNLYLKFARLALADRPELLECIGIKHTPRKKRKSSPEEPPSE